MMPDEKADNFETGRSLGRYRIVEKLGAGGMGEVYLAEDTRLRRKVALKILPGNIAADADRLRRFEREAHSASALNHPNILTIHEFGAEGEKHFLASEFVEGETLRDRLNRESLTLSATLDIAIQIASALEAAHTAGIIHRDVKPENVMIRADGYVKVLDFGLAKLVEKTASDEEAETKIQLQTQAGMILGTVAYMSPEQTRGLTVDARTDIFSFGVVLYEMLTGEQPFTGETINHTIVAILEKNAPPVARFIDGYPVEIERIVKKCLAKKADERYSAAKNLLTDLKELKEELNFQSKLERASAPNKKAEAETQIIKAATTAETHNSIAVLPFENMSADAENEYFCDGLAEELLNALAKIDDLKVAARTSAFSFRNKNVEVGEIGNALNVKTVLEGSVRKSGNKLRITVQLINVADGYHLWSERYDREMRDIFDVQDEITLAVVDALKLKLFGDEKDALLKRYTDNTEAYELYLKGLYHNNKHTAEGWLKGIEFFEQAIQIEPEYAPAYAGIGICCTTLYIFGVLPPDRTISKWKAAVSRALEINNRLAEAHLSSATLNFYHGWNWAEAEREYRRAIELNANYADNYWLYGLFLASRGRFDEAIGESRRAIELDPLSLPVNLLFGWINFAADRLEETLAQAREMLEIEPNFHGAYWLMGLVAAARGEYEEAVKLFEKAMQLGGTQIVLAQLGCACGLADKRDEALKILNELLKMRELQYATAFNIARVYAGLGLTDEAFAWMEKAVEERNGEMVYLARTTVGTAESLGGNFSNDSRFQDILRRAGLSASD